MTPNDIRKALRRYADLRRELDGLLTVDSYPTSSIPRIGRAGGGHADPTGRAAERLLTVWERLRRVESWLRRLHDISPVLRVAAEPWTGEAMTDEVAERLGLVRREAQLLSEAVPLVIWATEDGGRDEDVG